MEAEKRKPYDYAVFIGRFQPFHNGHLFVTNKSLEKAEKLIFIIGSDRMIPSFRCPWSSKQRIEMIKRSLPKTISKKIIFICVRDIFYDEKLWRNLIFHAIYEKVGVNKKIALIGHKKDKSSYYLDHFSCWDFIEVENFENINATNIRQSYFFEEDKNKIKPYVSKKIFQWLTDFSKTDHFSCYVKEFKKYLKISKNIKNVIFFVFYNDFILIQKKSTYLKTNLYSLPHCEGSKKNLQNLLPFLDENILPNIDFKKYYKTKKIFPSPFDVTINNNECFIFDISAEDELYKKKLSLPNLKWIFLSEIYLKESYFFEDHYQIIYNLLRTSVFAKKI